MRLTFNFKISRLGLALMLITILFGGSITPSYATADPATAVQQAKPTTEQKKGIRHSLSKAFSKAKQKVKGFFRYLNPMAPNATQQAEMDAYGPGSAPILPDVKK